MENPSNSLVTSSPLLFVVLALAILSGESLFAVSTAVICTLGIFGFALIVRTLDDLQKGPKAMMQKVIWGIAIFVLPFIGPFLYMLVSKDQIS